MSQLCATLNTGAKMPLMGFGTLMESLEPDADRVVSVVEAALNVGYRHLDTAQVYQTETMVGRALNNQINSGLVARDDVFVCTKLWRTMYRRDDVVPSLRASLARLGLQHVDLFLIHWPTAFQPHETHFPKNERGDFLYADTDYVDTWRGMEECVDQGLARAIGVSNFNSSQIQRILDICTIKPANNQVESHPFLNNKQIIEFCQAKGITVTAYAPLAGFNADYRESQGWPTIFKNETLNEIGKKYGKTSAQVSLRFQLQRGVAVVPKSCQQSRMQENFQALDFDLTEEEMKQIVALDRNMRLNAEFPDHPHYPFHDKF